MTDLHRAAPELWAAAEKWGANTMDMANCILELRARVEVLEAAQHAHFDISQLSEAEREQIRQELAKRPARQPTFAELLMPLTVFTADEVAPMVVPTVKESLTVAPALSPAAQAVLDAAYALPLKNGQPHLAAALRAAADQVVPDKCPPIEDFNEFDQGYAVAHITHRADLLAIAAELEGAR